MKRGALLYVISGRSLCLAFCMAALLFTIVLLSGCDGDDKATKPTPTNHIWPLKIGNQWTYEDQGLDSAGNIVQRDTTVIEIAKDTLIQGETWYILTVNGVRDPEMQPQTERDDGLWSWEDSSGFLFFKYPAAVGDTWMVWTDTATVESIDDTVEVPAGRFICINYKWVGIRDPQRDYQCHYMSPGTGRIKSEEFFRTESGFVFLRFRCLLISYNVL